MDTVIKIILVIINIQLVYSDQKAVEKLKELGLGEGHPMVKKAEQGIDVSEYIKKLEKFNIENDKDDKDDRLKKLVFLAKPFPKTINSVADSITTQEIIGYIKRWKKWKFFERSAKIEILNDKVFIHDLEIDTYHDLIKHMKNHGEIIAGITDYNKYKNKK